MASCEHDNLPVLGCCVYVQALKLHVVMCQALSQSVAFCDDILHGRLIGGTYLESCRVLYLESLHLGNVYVCTILMYIASFQKVTCDGCVHRFRRT